MTIHINEIMIIPNAEGHLMTTNKNGLANHWKKWDSHRKILTFLRVYGQSTLSVTRGSLWFESQVGIKLSLQWKIEVQLLGALTEYLKVRKIPSDYFASTLRDIGWSGRDTVIAIRWDRWIDLEIQFDIV